MNFVENCENCKRIIDKDFLYCPWCGTQKSEIDDKLVLDEVFRQLEVKQTKTIDNRLSNMQLKIAQLENELDSFVETFAENGK